MRPPKELLVSQRREIRNPAEVIEVTREREFTDVEGGRPDPTRTFSAFKTCGGIEESLAARPILRVRIDELQTRRYSPVLPCFDRLWLASSAP